MLKLKLDFFLLTFSASSTEPSSFASRLKIALGSAKGILYLHTEANPPIFHRDIKSSNILLDSKWTPKVADFGISKLAPSVDEVGAVPGPLPTNVKGSIVSPLLEFTFKPKNLKNESVAWSA